MIFGAIDNISTEIMYYPQVLQAGLHYLQTHDLAAASPGRLLLPDTDIAVNINEYGTEPAAHRHPEVHARYIDIQYIISGREYIGCGSRQQAGRLLTDDLTKNDVAFFADVTDEAFLAMTPGRFAIFFPWDLHRPNCHYDGNPQQVKKAVIKIPYKLLTPGL